MEHTTFPAPGPAPQYPVIDERGPSGMGQHGASVYPALAGATIQGPQYAGNGPAQPEPSTFEGEICRRVELPCGGFADFRDPKLIRAKHRKRALATLNMERMQVQTADVALDMVDGLMVMMIDKWSIPYLPLAGNSPAEGFSQIDELKIPDYDTISAELNEARKLLFPANPSVDDRRPGSPTPPAAG